MPFPPPRFGTSTCPASSMSEAYFTFAYFQPTPPATLASVWLFLTTTHCNCSPRIHSCAPSVQSLKEPSENANQSQASSGLPLPLEQSFPLVLRSSLISPCLSLWIHLLHSSICLDTFQPPLQQPSSCKNTKDSSLYHGIGLTVPSTWGSLIPLPSNPPPILAG